MSAARLACPIVVRRLVAVLLAAGAATALALSSASHDSSGPAQAGHPATAVVMLPLGHPGMF